jgi:hypothetical protein
MQKIAIPFCLFLCYAFSSYSQGDLSDKQSFGTSEGYERLYYNGAYHLKNLATGEIESFYDLKYVSNVENNHIVFKSKEGLYGIMTADFNVIQSPEWVEIKDFGFGYFALAHYSGQFVNEDRGSGLKQYPLLTWKVYSSKEDLFISEMELLHPICIYGEVLAETVDKRSVKIELGKINFGYTDPIMKALTYLSGDKKSAPESHQSYPSKTEKP